jgi:hypothetical protein
MRHEEDKMYGLNLELQKNAMKDAGNVRALCLKNDRLSELSVLYGSFVDFLERKINKMSTFLNLGRIMGRGMK